MRKLLLLLLFTAIALINYSQTTFQGSISYAINYKEVPTEMQSILSHLPSEMTVTYKDEKKREEVISSQSSKITITDMKNRTAFVLMRVFEEKIALVHDEETNEEYELYKKSKVKATDETKKIGDYDCKKLLIFLPEIKTPITVYVSQDYTSSDPIYGKLGGIPLEFTTNENGMVITYSMIKVLNKKISDKEFEIPTSYKTLTPEEFQKQFGME